jgi:hypothetical protein
MSFFKNILLIFLASFLFVGIIEQYKNNESLTHEILKTYSEIRIKQSSCHKSHNDFFLSYYPLAGSFIIQKQELKIIADHIDKNLSQEYFTFIIGILESVNKQKNNISYLKSMTESCYSLLHIEYESLAILLGIYKKYEEIVEQNARDINLTYKKQKEIYKKYTKNPKNDEILARFKSILLSTIDKNKINEFESKFQDLSNLQISLAKNEKLRFDIRSNTYKQLKDLYISTINKRLNRGFIDYVFNIDFN